MKVFMQNTQTNTLISLLNSINNLMLMYLWVCIISILYSFIQQKYKKQNIDAIIAIKLKSLLKTIHKKQIVYVSYFNK